MKKYIALLLVLLALATPASAAEKKDELRYEVNVTMRFNSLSVSEFVEVQKVLDGLAAKSCKTEVKLEKLPKDDGAYFTSGTVVWDPGSNSLEVK